MPVTAVTDGAQTTEVGRDAVSALATALSRATETRRVEIGRGALSRVADCFTAAFGDRPGIVVADETTFEVAGKTVERLLRAAGVRVLDAIVLPARPRLHAEYHHATRLRDRLATHDAIPIAAGSGTINDLTKLAAHFSDRPSMVVATAASMDGYAAFGAAITRDGFKQTIACPAPRAILADVDILAAAPPEMAASGFGDLLGKITAGADWLVAGALEIEPVDTAIWTLVQPAVREAIGGAGDLAGGDPASVERLFRCLVMSGLAMQAARSSRPASGAEHQFSHLWEMHGLSRDGVEISHGFKVGIGTLAVSALYEQLLSQDLTSLDGDAICRRWPPLAFREAEVRAMHPDPVLRDQALMEVRAKDVTPEQLRARLGLLRERWPALRVQLQEQLLPVTEVRRLLAAAGCPADPEEVGLTSGGLRDSFVAARHIRRRYTVLDLATETGLIEPALAAIFGTGGALGGAPQDAIGGVLAHSSISRTP